MIDWMVAMTSSETVTASFITVSARVWTADSTASLARSDFGLNSFWRSDANSSVVSA
jgi:hypothetical protein